ncbi:MAG: hypothetical protein ACREXP_06435 [Steroidobacteraceae bacterium]
MADRLARRITTTFPVAASTYNRTRVSVADSRRVQERVKKQHILDEIKLGGAALGAMERSRQGAGFTPNRMRVAFDEDRLLRPLVSLIRELGRFPVKHEMRMRKGTDAEFPNEKVFDRRFGTKPELAKHLLTYCERVVDSLMSLRSAHL